MIRGLRGENGALWQAGVKIVYELCSDWNRDPEETIRRFKKGNENEWLASVLPSKGRISFYQACEYLQEKELYQTYQLGLRICPWAGYPLQNASLQVL